MPIRRAYEIYFIAHPVKESYVGPLWSF